jgi:integrase
MRTASSQFILTGVSTLTRAEMINALPLSEARVPTVAQYTSTWLEGLEGLVSARTLEDYAGRLERHVLPRLGQRPLDEVGVDDVLALIADLRKRGYAGSTICTVLNPLSRLFAHAERRELIQVNPVRKLERSERPRVSRRERPALSRDEIGRLLEAARPKYRPLLATAILSGLRQGELLGLRWREIDFASEVIRVRSALDRKQLDAPPKTPHSLRDVVLMPAARRGASATPSGIPVLRARRPRLHDTVRDTFALGESRPRGCLTRRSERLASGHSAGTTFATPLPVCSSQAAPT